MKKVSKLRQSAIIAAVVAVAGAPVAASAVTMTEDTVVNVTIDSTVSLFTTGNSGGNGTVNMTVLPVTGGAQSSASDTVTVSTNNASGYNLTLADTDSDTNLVKGTDTIAAHNGTLAAPTALANNTWGYALPSSTTGITTPNGFDAAYSALTSSTASTSKWAGVPATGAAQLLKTTSGVASSDTTTVWYSAKVDTTKPTGTYTDTVTYTVTTNL